MLYEIPILKHIDARSVGEAIFWLHDYGPKARVMAGGTDLLSLIKDRIEVPELLVNIKPIPQANRMDYDEKQGLRIGAAVSLKQLESCEVTQKKYPLLAATARQVGTTQIRSMGTIGGNILQRPQCMYFRSPDFFCRKKGKTRCYAVTGEHRDYYAIFDHGKCIMAHPSDMAPALIALRAKAIVVGGEGEREVPLEDLFVGPNHLQETVLKPDELLLGFRVPNPDGLAFQSFLKHRIRRSSDFALASVAVAANLSDGICLDIRVVLGGVAPFPYQNSDLSEMLHGKRLTQETALEAAEISVKGARPLPMNGYKVEVTKSLVEKALMSISKSGAI